MPTPEQNGSTNPVVTPAKNKGATDIAGQKFGRLTVVSPAGKNRFKAPVWNCVCDCGTPRIVSVYALLNAQTFACGGHKAEEARNRFTRHGQAKNSGHSKTYVCWKAMIQRCTNPKRKGYHNYGGRGIRVCPEWISSFDQFFLDMGPVPPGRSLDRKNVNGNYEKSNCRWATPSEQGLNKRILNDNRAGATGVELVGKNCCSARLCFNGKRTYLGCWPRTPEGIQAASEAIKRARKLAELFS